MAARQAHGEAPPASAWDYDIHGIIGIRVLGGGDSEASTVQRQLGVEPRRLERPPDITIRFVERLDLSDPLCFLSGNAAFTENVFVLTAGRARRPVMSVPFTSLGERCELVVARGTSPVPLLVPIVLLTALGKGFLPVHASAFVHRGTGTLIAGGASGGKTGTLMAFMDEGATFVGDDWILLAADGKSMWGLEAPIQVKDAYLRALPRFRKRLNPRTLRRLRVTRVLAGAERRLPRGSGAASLSARIRSRVRGALEARLVARVHPAQLFGDQQCSGSGSLNVLCLARTKNTPGVELESVAPREIADRLAPLLEHEWSDLDRSYALFRSAFPGSRNYLLERRGILMREGLRKALVRKRTLLISYPSPAPVKEVFRTLAPWLAGQLRIVDDRRGGERP